MDKERLIAQLATVKEKISNGARFRLAEATKILDEITETLQTEEIDLEVQSRIALREAQAQKFLADAEQTRAITKNQIERKLVL